MPHATSTNLIQDLNSPFLSIILVIAMIGYIVYRQLTPRKLSVRGLAIFPAIILLVALEGLLSFHPTRTDILELGIDTVVTTVLGLCAARQLTVYADSTSGRAAARGSWRYFLWWVAAFAVKILLAMVFQGGSQVGLSQVEILAPVFVLMVTRNAYLYWKAGRLGLTLR